MRSSVLLALACVLFSAPALGDREKVIKRPFRAEEAPLGDGPIYASRRYQGYLDRSHYESVRDAALSIMRRYPPDQFLYVGVGRAPTSLVTFFRHLDPSLAVNFPASGLGSAGGREISASARVEYERHFAALIGEGAVRRKKILLLDRSYQGGSVHRLAAVLRPWVQAHGGLGVTALGVLMSSSSWRAKPAYSDVEYLDSAPYPKLFLWGDGYGDLDYDEDIGEYGHHAIGPERLEALAAKRNTLHSGFVEGMRRRMASDAALDRALTTEFAEVLSPDSP